MRIEGTFTFAVPLRSLKAALRNPDVLARALPGCERLTQMGPADAQGAATYEVRMRLQPSASPVQATLRVAQPSEREIRVEVRGVGPNGPLTARGTMTLLDQGTQTQSIYSWETPASASSASAAPEAIPAPTNSANGTGSATNGKSTDDQLIADFYTQLETLARGSGPAVGTTGPLLAETPRGRILRQSKLDQKALETPTQALASRALLVGAGIVVGVGVLVVTARILRRIRH